MIHKEKPVPERLKERLSKLFEQGVIKKVGRGRGTKYILSRKFYKFLDKKGVYTRRRGFARERNKEFLLKHITDNQKEGSPLKDLREVLPDLNYTQVQNLLQELKNEGKIHPKGRTRGARWFPDPASE